MSSVLTNLSVIQKLAQDLVQAKHLNYSEECLPYYVDESKFMIEHIEDLRNPSGFLLKSSLIRHRALQAHAQQKHHHKGDSHHIAASETNSKCVVFLHGLGSSRLEALPLVDSLPLQYCLFAFDFAGSGKSQGDNITYGLRQSEDICSILDYLRTNKGLKQFVIWGRSMGAVACLLYSINLAQSSKTSISASSQLQRIKGLVVDSPFSDFREVTKHIGLKRVNVPQFLIDFALSIIQTKFNELLKDQHRNYKIYNPFQIKLGTQNIDTKIPTVFLYSMIDEVVPKQHSEKIVKVYKSLFDKIIMNECSHNQARPRQTIERVFEILKKFQYRMNYNRMVGTSDQNRGLSRNNSLDLQSRGGRRGISVQSRQKQKSFVVMEKTYTQSSQVRAEDSKISRQSYSSLKIEPRKQKISCRMSKNAYMGDSPTTANNQSPLKIRLSNSFNRSDSKISISVPKKGQQSKPQSGTNFYSTIQYDNSILQKKLLRQTEQSHIYKALQNKNNFKYRRGSQLTRKVEYQLNHTRYL